MHRVINNSPDGVLTDHVDGDTLNNQCSNLRDATYSENGRNRAAQADNTSGYKGVSWFKRVRLFKASIKRDGKQYHLGYFNTAEEAARAYDAKAKELFGEFAKTNF